MWVIDPVHSSVDFSVRHLGLSTVRGSFSGVSGEIDFDPDEPTSVRGRIEIDASSLDTRDPRRDEHLRSADFFDVEHHPTITFEPTRVERADDGHFKVRGNLTIRGITREVELDAEYSGTVIDPWGNRRAGGTLTGVIDRTDFGLKWNQALEAGRLLVGEKVKLQIDVQFVESVEAIGRAARGEAESARAQAQGQEQEQPASS
jgi:polyisoprenoid-binding protein YceI